MACASCHPEGADDGLVWNFQGGPFRTISLRGFIGGSAPFHWNGQFNLLSDLTASVFVRFMGGPSVSADYSDLLQDWLDSLPIYTGPAPATPEARAAIMRGDTVFRSLPNSCDTCHRGPNFTNARTMNIGTGGSFQVPSLTGVRFRAPYMHNGCATSLAARGMSRECFGPMHPGYDFTAAEESDLLAFLNSI